MRAKKFLSTFMATVVAFTFVVAIVPQITNTDVSAAEMDDRDRVIVSLGDSYSSGEGIEPYVDEGLSLEDKVTNEDWLCHRSKNAWSSMLTLKSGEDTISMKRDENWYFAAMSGAVTNDIANATAKEYKKYKSLGFLTGTLLQGSVPIAAQVDIFDKVNKDNKKVDYVTLTIGGNDADFSKVVTKAALQFEWINFKGMELEEKVIDPNDKKTLSAMIDDILTKKLDGILGNIENSYKGIQSKAGVQAHIIVAGYPRLFWKSHIGAIFSLDEVEKINGAVDKFNSKIRERIDKCRSEGMDIHFVDVAKGQGTFEGFEDLYVNKLTLHSKEDIDDKAMFGVIGAASFHPNILGAKVYANCVQKTINRLEDTVKISGTIKDENNNNLKGVTVTLVDSDNKSYPVYVREGCYFAEEISKENKNLTLTFEKNGYVTTSRSIIDVNEDRTVNVKLEKKIEDNPNIPDDAPTFNGHSYYLYSDFTWEEAKEFCESVDGHLVTITSEDEMNFIKNEIENNGMNMNCYWIGLSRNGNSWSWVTDEPFDYANWAENEPEDYQGQKEYFVHLFGKDYTEDGITKLKGTWNNVSNEGAAYKSEFYDLSHFGFICEWDSVNSKKKYDMYSQYFTIEPIVSSYGDGLVDEYGVRLVVNKEAKVKKCAVYMEQASDGVWKRTLAFIGDNVTSAQYAPYVAYQGRILYDGFNNYNINIKDMYKNTDGIWSVDGCFQLITADLTDNNGNDLTLRSTSVVGNNVKIFDDLDKMKSWLLS